MLLDSPLRAELFHLDRLKEYARELAARHDVVEHRGRNDLLARLPQNGPASLQAYQAVTGGGRVTLATEWLIDNFPLIGQQINIARTHLPKAYSGQLPRLRDGHPRVYDLALELISHTDGRVDAENLSALLSAY